MGTKNESNMQCRDVRELAESYLGEELLVETNHDILRHLEACPSCRAEIEARRTMRAQVRRAFLAVDELRPADEWKGRVVDRLRAEAQGRRGARPSIFRSWWALAATLLVAAAAAGLVVRGRVGVAELGAIARDAAGDHRNCAVHFNLAERPIPLEEAARRYDVAYRGLETVPAVTTETANGAVQVLERHACVFAGRRFAHIVLRYQGRVVSLLVTRDDRPGWMALPRRSGSSVTLLARADAFDVAYARAGGHLIFFVGDAGSEPLLQVAEAVTPGLARRLVG